MELNKKYGIIMLVIGIPITGYLSLTLFPGIYRLIIHFESVHMPW
jgi:hypothetical protein